MPNRRIIYASEQVVLGADGEAGVLDPIYGCQSIGMSANIPLTSTFELGQLAIYQQIESIPDITADLSKVLDGRPLMWHMATKNATSPTLRGRSDAKCILALGIFSDTADSADGTPLQEVQMSGMFTSSLAYSFDVNSEYFTETLSLVGNDRRWVNDPKYADAPTTNKVDGAFAGNNDSPDGTGGVNQRQHLIFEYNPSYGLDVNGMVADPDTTILPPEVYGISDSGTNNKVSDVFGAHIQSINISTQLGRDQVLELGRLAPYYRPATFPTEVTCEVTAISTEGDLVSTVEDGIYASGVTQCQRGTNLKDRTIRVATCEGTRIYLGTKNRLTSVNYSGGDTGGGNVTITYSFTTQNELTVIHVNDPHASGTVWWNNRANYLTDV